MNFEHSWICVNHYEHDTLFCYGGNTVKCRLINGFKRMFCHHSRKMHESSAI